MGGYPAPEGMMPPGGAMPQEGMTPLNGSESGLDPTIGQGPTPAQIDLEETLLLALMKRGKRTKKVELTQDQYTALSNKIVQDFDGVASIRGIFKEKHEQFLKDWRGVVEPKDEPYENCANVKVPCISYNIEQQKARLLKAVAGEPVSRLVEFSALADSVPLEMLTEVNDWFNWELHYVVKARKVLRKILHYALIDGFCVAIPRYVVEKKNLKVVREFDLVDAAPLEEQIALTMTEIFPNAELEIEATGVGKYKVIVTGDDGEPSDAKLTYWIKGTTLGCDVESEVIVFDGVKIDVLSTESICSPNSHEEINRLPFFGWRGWLLAHDYEAGVASGLYIDHGKDVTAHVLASAGPKQESTLAQFQTDLLDDEEGGDSKDLALATENVKEYGWIEVYNWEGRFDVDGTGPVGVLVRLDPASKVVLSIDRLEDITGTGERTGVKFSYIEQPDRFFPIGLAEWLQHSQAEIDAIHNQRLDAGLLSNFPYFFYTPAAGSPNAILKLSPGCGNPIKDINSISFPKNNWEPSWSFREEAQSVAYAKQQAGLTDPALGNFISKRTSATEFQSTVGAVDIRTDMIVESMLESFHTLFWRAFELYRRHVPVRRVYQVAGPNGAKFVKKLNRSSLNAKLMMEMNGNALQIDPQLQRDIAVNMFQILSSPLPIQFGIVQPDTVYEALMRVTKSMHYKGIPLHEPDVPAPSESPEAELRRMMLGEIVQPSPVENFAHHLKQHNDSLTNPFVPPEVKMWMQQHIQATLMLQQQVTMMREVAAMQAAGTQDRMSAMGIRPGLAGGGQSGNNANPASAQEGGPGQDEGNDQGGSAGPT